MGKRACFQQKIQEHIKEHFNYPPVAVEMGIQGKVFVQFVIDVDGWIAQIRTRGPDKVLEAEAERIISALPRMVPWKQRGRPVKVPYSIPINFRLMRDGFNNFRSFYKPEIQLIFFLDIS